MDRIFSNNLTGLVPVYVDNIGDCTKVHLENQNPFIIEKNISTVLHLLYKYYALDIREIKSICSKYILSKNLIPIAFDRYNIFVPFKSRKPKYNNDKTFGYFNLNYYLDHTLDQDSISICMTDGQKLNCISKEDSFKNHLRDGRQIRALYIKRQMGQSKNYYPSKETDLNIIVKELNEIKYLLKGKTDL